MGGAAIPTEEPDSDAFDEETEEADEQAASPPSPVATDAAMASSETAIAVSISSATPELAEEATVPSSLGADDCDSQMCSGEGAAVNETEGERLSDRPSSPATPRVPGSPATVQDDECTALPPSGVDNNADDSSSNVSESPIKRRPAAKAAPWRIQPKKLRQTVGYAQHLGSVPEHAQEVERNFTI